MGLQWMPLVTYVTVGINWWNILSVIQPCSKVGEFGLYWDNFVISLCTYCQEIGLVAAMFFFELLFSYASFAISFYVFLTYSQSLILLSANFRDTQDKGSQENDVFQ